MSQLEVDKIVPQSGTTLTIGDSGDTISIPSGVTLSNAGTNTFASATITGDLTVDTNTLYVDSTNNYVGIGTSTPAEKLEVYGTETSGGVELLLTNVGDGGISTTPYTAIRSRLNPSRNGGEIRFGRDSNYGSASTADSNIQFYTALDDVNTERMRIDSSGRVRINNTTSTGHGNIYNLIVGNESSGGDSGILITAPNNENSYVSFGDSDGVPGLINYNHASNFLRTYVNGSERMRIDSSGNVLVGTTSNAPAQDNVTGVSLRPTDASEFSQNGEIVLSLNRKTSDGEILRFRKDGTTVGDIGTEGGDLVIGTGDTALQFADSLDSIRPFTSSGSGNSGRDNAIDLGRSAQRFKDLYLGGGLYVGGTAAANHLDDYEEGTFTAELSSTGATFTYTVRQGWYVKVGNRVMFNIYIQLDGTPFTTTSNNTYITGFPFTSGNLSGNENRMICGTRVVSFSSGQTFLMANLGTNANTALLIQGGSGSTGVPLPSNALSNASGQIFLSGSYQTA